jgi:hypothetical protein
MTELSGKNKGFFNSITNAKMMGAYCRHEAGHDETWADFKLHWREEQPLAVNAHTIWQLAIPKLDSNVTRPVVTNLSAADLSISAFACAFLQAQPHFRVGPLRFSRPAISLVSASCQNDCAGGSLRAGVTDGRNFHMIRNALIACAASAFMLGIGTTFSLAAAPGYMGATPLPSFEYKQDARHYRVVCRTKQVSDGYGGYRYKKVCKKVYYKHSYGY